jgi:hypothetical protein
MGNGKENKKRREKEELAAFTNVILNSIFKSRDLQRLAVCFCDLFENHRIHPSLPFLDCADFTVDRRIASKEAIAVNYVQLSLPVAARMRLPLRIGIPPWLRLDDDGRGLEVEPTTSRLSGYKKRAIAGAATRKCCSNIGLLLVTHQPMGKERVDTKLTT